MGFLDRLLGRPENDGRSRTPAPSRQAPADPDEAAIERYRYMLRTAPPETIEQAHAEAFATLTPAQREQVLTELGSTVEESERARTSEPRDLARMATRAEIARPGTMERSLGGGMGGGMGMGGLIAGSLLASVAGAFIGTSIAGAFMDGQGGDESGGDAGGEESGGEESGSAEDGGGGDYAGGESGGGDFGGGDFGGGDFGGGDF